MICCRDTTMFTQRGLAFITSLPNTREQDVLTRVSVAKKKLEVG